MRKLHEIRKEKNISQQELADMIGVNQGCISMYENGQRSPRLEIAAKIAAALGVTVDDLIGEKKAV